MRSPALPSGSLVISSALAWITSAVPPLLKTEWRSVPSVTPRASTVVPAVPLEEGKEAFVKAKAPGALKVLVVDE